VNNANSHQFSLRATQGSLELRAELSARGAALTGLWVDDLEIAGDPQSVGLESAFVGSTLAPWPNRIAGARWQLADEELRLSMNEPDRNNALHGLVFDVDFSLRGQTADAVTLGYELVPSSGYPFHLDLEVSYRLVATGLEVSTRVENLGAQPAPFGLAFHPYFKVLSQETVLETSFASFLETNANLIPTGRTLPLDQSGLSDGAESSQVRALAAELDHCFSDPRPGAIFTRLRSEMGVTTIWQQPEFGYCMVFSGRVGDETNLGYLAIEPQTMPADAFNTGKDLLLFEPGSVTSFGWGVSFSS
jgi:aldose 1-epimerase